MEYTLDTDERVNMHTPGCAALSSDGRWFLLGRNLFPNNETVLLLLSLTAAQSIVPAQVVRLGTLGVVFGLQFVDTDSDNVRVVTDRRSFSLRLTRWMQPEEQPEQRQAVVVAAVASAAVHHKLRRAVLLSHHTDMGFVQYNGDGRVAVVHTADPHRQTRIVLRPAVGRHCTAGRCRCNPPGECINVYNLCAAADGFSVAVVRAYDVCIWQLARPQSTTPPTRRGVHRRHRDEADTERDESAEEEAEGPVRRRNTSRSSGK